MDIWDLPQQLSRPMMQYNRGNLGLWVHIQAILSSRKKLEANTVLLQLNPPLVLYLDLLLEITDN